MNSSSQVKRFAVRQLSRLQLRSWPRLAALVLACTCAALSAAQNPTNKATANGVPDDTAGPDLTGALFAKDGKPLSGTVFIATAAPKVGTSVLCPSCYFDCTKNSKTDATGAFRIESLDPQLTFQVLAVAKGYKPKSVSKVDPAKGPIKVTLDPIESSDAAPDRTLRGRVVDPAGNAIEGAVVNMYGIETRDGAGRFGSLPGIDPLAVTDENGEFMITAREPFELMIVKVEARMFANRTFGQLPSGLTTNILTMTEGASLTGRVLHEGKPMSNIVMGISGKDRSAGEYVGHFEITTGPEGNFLFVNLPPETEYVLYGVMSSLKGVGAVPARTVRSGKDGEKIDAGEMVPVAGHRLAGKVELTDGATVPENTRLLLSREQAWDSLQITLAKDGSFDVSNLPPETVSLSIRVKDYRVSPRNRSFDPLNSQLLGRIDRDITNFVLRLDKGATPESSYNLNSTYEWPGSKPLRGAEGGVDHSDEWKVTGHVLDGTTKEPIAGFRVTPGAGSHGFNVDWDSRRVVDGTNGSFTAYVPKSFGDPQLKVEADGYQPASVAVPQREAATVSLELQKGSGPDGVVLGPNGKPESSATVVMVAQTYNQANLNSRGELSTHWNRSALQKTGTDGRFSFKPQLGIKAIAVSSSNGFAFVRLEDLAKDQTIRLQAFGKIAGTLMRGSSPVTNETLDVGLPELSTFGITISTPSVTDSQGRFEFRLVPAGTVQISSRQMMGNTRAQGWTSLPLKQLELEPGQSIEETISAPEKTVARDIYQPSSQPELRRVPGQELKGVVLLPDGKPGVDVEVAVHVRSRYLAIGKGKLSHGSREDNLSTHTGPDGSFSLPLYEDAQSIVAINSEGIAQLPLEKFRTTPKITLQKWGSIEGTVTADGGRVANEVLTVNAKPQQASVIHLDHTAFTARTDEKGSFVVPMLPPGTYAISRRIQRSANSATSHPIGTVTVESGKAASLALVLDGRKVLGRVVLPETIRAIDLPKVQATLQTPMRALLSRSRELKTKEEREAFQKEYKALFESLRTFPVTIRSDGSFEADQVKPGKYELSLFFTPDTAASSQTNFFPAVLLSKEPLDVPEGKTSNGPVNLGSVAVEKLELPVR